jgi:uncharacterized protein (TIGR02444 family)
MADAPKEDALWRFSLSFYSAPGVAEALITLQDRAELDVNLTLFALWFGLSGRGRLDTHALAAAERAVETIRTDIVEPLRSLRRRLKNHPDDDVQQLREGVKALELAGEELAQARLARLAGALGDEAPLKYRLADAYANLALYIGPDAVRSGEARIIREALGALAHRPLPVPPPQAGEG